MSTTGSSPKTPPKPLNLSSKSQQELVFSIATPSPPKTKTMQKIWKPKAPFREPMDPKVPKKPKKPRDSPQERKSYAKDSVKSAPKSFYAVRVGKVPGIYRTWKECREQIFKYPKATYKGFVDEQSALKYLEDGKQVSESHTTKADLIVYTDGSEIHGAAGAGIWFGKDDPRNTSSKVPGEQTNQRGEAWAVWTALRITKDMEGILEIRSDTLYAINGATGAHTTVANRDIFQLIWKELDARKARGFPVQFTHVYGHTGIEGNEGADKLAKSAARLTLQTFQESLV